MKKITQARPLVALINKRFQRNWSQQEVADHLGTTPGNVSRWERGITVPSAYFRHKLCELFGTNAEELGFGPEKLPPLVPEEVQVSASIERLNSPDTTRLKNDAIGPLAALPLLHQAFQGAHPTDQRQRNRTRMLQRLHHSYRTLLVQSLQGSAWIDVGLSLKPDAVRNTTTLLFRSANQGEHLLPSGTSILQVYEEAGRELLILGEPGTGKSMLLLHLALRLVENATQDDAHPLPVLLPLSSWAVKHSPLRDWISEQLTLIYDVPTRLAQQWVQEDDILPLLDGFDEMEEAARPACIGAINAYHREHLFPLVACSRMNEYTTATLSGKLTLHMAIVVQPLSAELVETHLANRGTPLAALRMTLRENSALQAVATTPLMLHILTLTYHGVSVQNLSHKEALLRQHLWTDYSERMMNSKGNAKRYPHDTTRTRLGWLARQMRQQNQTIFYLEQVQSEWLEQDASQQTYQRWAILLPNALAAGLLGMLAGTLFFSSSFSLGVSVLLFTLTGVFLTMRGNETAAWSGKPFWKSLWHRPGHLWVPLCSSIGAGLGATAISLLTHDGQGIYHLQNGLSYGIAGALLSVLLRTGNPSPEPTGPFSWSSRGIHQWFLTKPYRRDGLSIGLSCAVGFGLHELFRRGPLYALGEGLHYGLLLGGTGVLLSILIQVLQMRKEVVEPKETIEPVKEPTWSWRRAWHHLFAWKHLKNILLVGSSVILIMGIDFLIRGIELQKELAWQKEGETVIGYGISIGIITLSTSWLQQWYRGGLLPERLPETPWLKPNQRIWSFVHDALLIAGINTVVGWLSYALSYPVHAGAGGRWSQFAFLFGILFGLSAGVLSGLLYGGLVCLRHLVLRLLLWRTHVFPWNVTPFLEDATTRILLRRVGGGYSFTHRLLMDYFADRDAALPLESIASENRPDKREG